MTSFEHLEEPIDRLFRRTSRKLTETGIIPAAKIYVHD